MASAEFPELINVTQVTTEEVVRLYRAYVKEWEAYEHAARAARLTRPRSWTVAL
jgi:hypothetical protein